MSTTPAELILLDRRAEVRAGGRHVAALGQQHRERRVPRRGRRARSTTWWPGAGSAAPGFKGPWTFATPDAARRTSRRSPSSIPRSRVLASVPGTQQAAEAVLLAQIPQTARVNKKQAEGARGQVPGRARSSRRSRRPRSSAPSTPTRASSRSATCTTCASRASGSWAAARPAPGRWRARCRARSTRSRSARPPTTSPT